MHSLSQYDAPPSSSSRLFLIIAGATCAIMIVALAGIYTVAPRAKPPVVETTR